MEEQASNRTTGETAAPTAEVERTPKKKTSPKRKGVVKEKEQTAVVSPEVVAFCIEAEQLANERTEEQAALKVQATEEALHKEGEELLLARE